MFESSEIQAYLYSLKRVCRRLSETIQKLSYLVYVVARAAGKYSADKADRGPIVIVTVTNRDNIKVYATVLQTACERLFNAKLVEIEDDYENNYLLNESNRLNGELS